MSDLEKVMIEAAIAFADDPFDDCETTIRNLGKQRPIHIERWTAYLNAKKRFIAATTETDPC